MMKRTVYEAPVTERFQVELEGVFCASIIDETRKGNATIIDQGINTSNGWGDFNDGFNGGSWTIETNE